jgi:hypothetical protein
VIILDCGFSPLPIATRRYQCSAWRLEKSEAFVMPSGEMLFASCWRWCIYGDPIHGDEAGEHDCGRRSINRLNLTHREDTYSPMQRDDLRRERLSRWEIAT